MKRFTLFLIFLTLLTLQTQRTQQTFTQWYQQQIPVNKPITGIKFIDTLNGWACTGDFLDTSSQNAGYIIHTTNGGNNWFIQFSRTPFAFSAMTMVNNMIGYAFGDSLAPIVGRTEFFKTTNGGLNWVNISIPYNMWISQFYFLNPDTGWFADNAASSPDIQLTIDGGYTWQLRTNGITGYPSNGVFFLNYNTGFCGSGSYLYKTINGGLNWNLNYDNVSDIYSILFINESIGWIGIFNKQIKYTSDGGNSWNNQILPPMAGTSIYNLEFVSDSILYAGQGYEFIFRTNNRGLNWGYQIDSGSSYRLSIIDSSIAWTGYLGIYKTTNGGGPITYVGIINIGNKIPEKYKLYQNFPNPFNPNTKIKFSLLKSSYVRLNIFDVNGKEKVIWNSDKELRAGEHELNFDGSGYASGVYFYQIIITDLEGKEVFRGTKKMILVK